LKRLNISSNNLKSPGASQIGEALKNPECRLLDLDLSNNFIETNGATDLHYGMISNRKLLRLNLGMNVGIQYSLILKIKKSLIRNKQLADKAMEPKLSKEKTHLKNNCVSWRRDLVLTLNKIDDTHQSKQQMQAALASSR
jgi:hypothetical protein